MDAAPGVDATARDGGDGDFTPGASPPEPPTVPLLADDTPLQPPGEHDEAIRALLRWGEAEVAETGVPPATAKPDPKQDTQIDTRMRLALIRADRGHERAVSGAPDEHVPDEHTLDSLTAIAPHPLGPTFIRDRGISAGAEELLQAAQRALATPGNRPSPAERTRRSAALTDLAQAWLYRLGQAAAAADTTKDALALLQGQGRTGSAPPSEHHGRKLRYLYALALAADERWADLGDMLATEAASSGADAALIAEAAHVLLDRLDDRGRAAALLTRFGDPRGSASLATLSDATRIHGYRVLTIALDVTSARKPRGAEGAAAATRLEALERQRLAMLARVDGAEHEAAAIELLLASSTGGRNQPTALDSCARLATPDPEQESRWGPHLAAMLGYRLSRDAGEWKRAVDFLGLLHEAALAGQLSSAYAWRAAELTGARLGLAEDALAIWESLSDTLDVPNEQLERARECALLGDTRAAELLAQLEAAAQHAEGVDPAWQAFCLRRAAAVAESRLEDLERAATLQRAAATLTEDPSDLEHLVRLYRQLGDREQLLTTYRALIEKIREPRSGTAYLCAVGALEWSCGRTDAAEEAFSAAARQSPRDPISRLALAALYRADGRRRELVTVLARVVELVTAPTLTVALLCELGQLYASEFNNTRRARETLDRALAIAPDSPGILHTLATLAERNKKWDEAVELRKRALDAIVKAPAGSAELTFGEAETPLNEAALWLEIGAIEEEQRRDSDAALAAYLAARRAGPASPEALSALERLYRRLDRREELREVLTAQLAFNPEPARQVAIQLDIAALTGSPGDGGDDASLGPRNSDLALDAYMQALAVDPGNETALSGVAAIAKQDGRWELVVEAYRAAPTTPENQAVLADALSELEAWDELAALREQLLDASDDPVAQGQLAHELAELYHRRLGNIDRALSCYERAVTSDPTRQDSQRALDHLLAEHGRWNELAQSYQRELDNLSDDDLDSRARLLQKLGALRRDHLDQPARAAAAYEEALALDPGDPSTLTALTELYERTDNEADLLRILSTRAATSEDDHERCELYQRIGELKQAREDIDGAVIAYRQAFEAEPTNRTAFTDMEKLCYRYERWNDAMALYNNAIERVESGLQRAYRLGDLYARRGQIQLQYLKRMDDAATSYKRVVELDPDSDTAIKYLDSILSEQSDWGGLISTYETRAQLTTDDSKRIDSYRRAARIAGNKLKDPEHAARIYEQLLTVDESDHEALDILERFYDRSENWESLVGVLERRLTQAPADDSAAALLRRIAQVCEEGLRDPKRAASNYRRILERTPGNREALEALGRIYESTERWTDFIEVTRRQIRVTSDRNVKALLYFKCGSVMEAKFGKEEDAIRYYDAAIKTSPSCLPAVHGLRDLYRRREDWPRVIQTLELEVKLWQDKKERAGVSAQIGRIYAQNLKEPQMALHYYESALAIDPDCLPANQALFEHYFTIEEWTRAKPLAQALVQKAMREGDPGTRSEFYRRYGVVNYKTGDPRTGADSLVTALEIQPHNRNALDALGELARAHPDTYGYADTYRELEKIYRKQDNAEPLMARVRIAQAVMREREGDLDGAAALYEEANAMCRQDMAVLKALVDFHCAMRRMQAATDAIEGFLHSTPSPSRDGQVGALMRLAEIYADFEREPARAVEVFERVIALDPDHQDAHYQMAQELFALERFGDAQRAIDRAIELAAAPGQPVSPSLLARYYYYKGRIIEAGGDDRKAASQYRRAAEYDPAYSSPVLALARRAIEQNEQRQAETLLINAAHAAMEHSGVEAAVPLQRGLARILLLSGDRKASIEAYRGILNVRPDDANDRYALAMIYSDGDPAKAITELGKSLIRDIYHAPTYQLMARLLVERAEIERARRVFSSMDALGFSDGIEPNPASEALAQSPREPLQIPLTDDSRQRLFLLPSMRTPIDNVYTAISDQLALIFPHRTMGENLFPVQQAGDEELLELITEIAHAYCIDPPEIYVGEEVPKGMVVLAKPRPIVVLDKRMLTAGTGARRFLLAWAFDAIRGDYAQLFNLSQRQQEELIGLLDALLAPKQERTGPTREFIESLPEEATQVIEQYAGRGREVSADYWFSEVIAMAARAGLFACDDLDAALRVIARMNGEELPAGTLGTAGLGAVLGGADMIRFYLSEEYHQMRRSLTGRASQPMS